MAKVTINKFNIIILDNFVNGKRYRLSTGKKVTQELVNWYQNNFQEEFDKLYKEKMGYNFPISTKFKEYGRFVIEITKMNRNKFSQKEEFQRFNKLCEFFGDMDISQIKVSHILKWQLDSGYAPKTIKNYKNTLNQIMQMAYYDEFIKRNPVKFVKSPRRIRKKVEVFTEEEIKLLLDNSFGQMKNILQFNFFEGLRGSELIALRWKSIDFEKNLVTISSRIRDGDEDETKSKQIRVIELLPQAKKALLNQKKLTYLKSDFIFLTQYGKVYKSHDTISEQLKKLCKKVGIKERTFHVTRKTCNTLYKQYGLPSDWILHQLGHLSDEVNRNHYTGKIKVNLSEIGKVLSH